MKQKNSRITEMKEAGKQGLGLFLDLLFPPRCPGCDEILPLHQQGFCEKCKPKIERVHGPVCMKCGKPVTGKRRVGRNTAKTVTGERVKPSALWGRPTPTAPPLYCCDCRSRAHAFDSGRAVYIYQESMKQAIYRFKYSNRRMYARVFAGDLRADPDLMGWLRIAGAMDAVVPVPMYRRKERIRGYNQAAVFGRAVAELIGAPLREDLIVRKEDTPALKTMTPEQRRKALFHAFQYIGSAVKLNRILLIDDIYTTGTTVDAVSRVFRAAGVREIYVLCICVGRGNF